jgi:hypothetical protein
MVMLGALLMMVILLPLAAELGRRVAALPVATTGGER